MIWLAGYLIVAGLSWGFCYAIAMSPPKSKDAEVSSFLLGVLWPLTLTLFVGMVVAKALGVRWSA